MEISIGTQNLRLVLDTVERLARECGEHSRAANETLVPPHPSAPISSVYAAHVVPPETQSDLLQLVSAVASGRTSKGILVFRKLAGISSASAAMEMYNAAVVAAKLGDAYRPPPPRAMTRALKCVESDR